MSKPAVILCACFVAIAARAQLIPTAMPQAAFKTVPGARMHTSLTRQFEIRDPDHMGGQPVPITDTNRHYIRVDATLLAVSCERIKHSLLSEFGATDNWRDKIYIDLRRARALGETIVIDTEPYGRDWTYHVSLPDTVENTRLVTSIVDVLLLEMANRNSKRPVELPAWLGYGLAEDILRSSHTELVLDQVRPGVAGQKSDVWMGVVSSPGAARPAFQGAKLGEFTVAGVGTNSLAIAHADLQASPPLTLDQLSWPDNTQLDGPAGETFRSSVQLFVHELLRLNDGQKAMRAFVQELPDHLNWQLSFLHAFRGDFAGQLELEKWWELRLVDFTGRDILETLSPEESWQSLQEIIRPVVDVRARPDELPRRTEMTLQTIIEKWDTARQFDLLKERSKMLYVLRSRVSQEMAKLTDDYRRTIDVYLDKRRQAGYLRTPRTREVMGLDEVEQQAISDLNILDGIGEDLRPKPVIMQSADVNQNANH